MQQHLRASHHTRVKDVCFFVQEINQSLKKWVNPFDVFFLWPGLWMFPHQRRWCFNNELPWCSAIYCIVCLFGFSPTLLRAAFILHVCHTGIAFPLKSSPPSACCVGVIVEPGGQDLLWLSSVCSDTQTWKQNLLVCYPTGVSATIVMQINIRQINKQRHVTWPSTYFRWEGVGIHGEVKRWT